MHAMQYEFTLREKSAPETEATRYEVLHLCAPHLDDIDVGRHW